MVKDPNHLGQIDILYLTLQASIPYFISVTFDLHWTVASGRVGTRVCPCGTHTIQHVSWPLEATQDMCTEWKEECMDSSGAWVT